MVVSNDERSEIVFFDVETTVPTRRGQGYAILEFGAILVCPKKLVELRNYSTLIRPAEPSRISSLSVQCNGITKDDVLSAPDFAAIADIVYEILHGRIWAGHNILRFDCPRIREAFAEIDRPSPEPKATIDSLALLTERFGRRAGNMKMATLATYFGLGQQTHRSLDDVRMNLEVLKYCATVLFLESSLPDTLIENCWASPSATTSGRSNGNRIMEKTPPGSGMQPSSSKYENYSAPVQYHATEENHSIMSPTPFGANSPLTGSHQGRLDSFNMTALCDEIHNDPLPEYCMEEEKPSSSSPESSNVVRAVDCSSCTEFVEPDDTSVPSISASLVSFYSGIQKIQILHKNVPLQLCSRNLKIRFGLSTKFVDNAGRPRLNFVLDASPDLCNVLDASDGRAQKLSIDSGSSSEWRPVVARKSGFFNSPTIRLHLPTVADGESMRWATEIYQKDTSTIQKLVFSRFAVSELDSLIVPGNLVDAYFSLEAYDYQQNAGIRLVAKKLILLSN